MKYSLNRITQSVAYTLISVTFISVLFSIGFMIFHSKKTKSINNEKELLISELKTTSTTLQELRTEIHNLNLENTKIKEQNKTFSERNIDLSDINLDLNNKTSSLMTSLNETVKTKNDLETKIEMLQNEKQALLEQMKTLESESFVKDTLRQKAFLEIETNKLRKQIKDLRIQSSVTLNKSNSAYNSEINKLKTEIEILKAETRQKEDRSEEINSLKKEVMILTKDNRQLQQQVVAFDEDKTNIADSFAQKLAIEKNKNNSLQNTLEQQYKKFNNIKTNNVSLLAEKTNIENQFAELYTQIDEKNSQIKRLQIELGQANQSLETRMRELSRTKSVIEEIISKTRTSLTSIDNTTKIITPTKPIVSKPKSRPYYKTIPKQDQTHKGEIIEVDYKHSFIVINLGAKHGVNSNMQIQILQDGNPIAKGNILEIRDEITAANVEMLGNHIVRKGDKATVLSKITV